MDKHTQTDKHMDKSTFRKQRPRGQRADALEKKIKINLVIAPPPPQIATKEKRKEKTIKNN